MILKELTPEMSLQIQSVINKVCGGTPTLVVIAVPVDEDCKQFNLHKLHNCPHDAALKLAKMAVADIEDKILQRSN